MDRPFFTPPKVCHFRFFCDPSPRSAGVCSLFVWCVFSLCSVCVLSLFGVSSLCLVCLLCVWCVFSVFGVWVCVSYYAPKKQLTHRVAPRLRQITYRTTKISYSEKKNAIAIFSSKDFQHFCFSIPFQGRLQMTRNHRK